MEYSTDRPTIISNGNTKYYEHNSPNISAKLRLIHAKQAVHQRRSMYIISPAKHTKLEFIRTLPYVTTSEDDGKLYEYHYSTHTPVRSTTW